MSILTLTNKRIACVAALLLLIEACALDVFGRDQQSTDVRELPAGQVIEREMMGAQSHHYTFDLRAGEFFQVRVEQMGIDVTLKLSEAGNNVLATMDSPNGLQGPETLSFIAEKPGGFVLEVSGLDPKADKGKYTIRREAPRAATQKDRRRVEVEQLFAAGMTARGVEGQADTAIKKLTAAREGWVELGDSYMAELTQRQLNALQIPPEITSIILGINKDLDAANNILNQGQQLSVKSKADSLPARVKLNESLTMFRALNEKLNDKASVEKVNQSGTTSQQTLNYLKASRYFAKLGEANSVSAIAQTYYNLSEWQEEVDYLKRALLAFEDTINYIAETDITGIDRKQAQLMLRAAEAAITSNLGGALNSRLGKPEEALKYLNQALEQLRALYQEAPTPQLKLQEANALQQIGLAHTSTSKNRGTGIEFLSRAIEIFRTFPDKKNEVATLLGLIGAQHSLDFNYPAALKSWDAALEIYREMDNKFGQMTVLQSKGTMYSLLDNKTLARETFNQVLAILQSSDFAENFKKQLPYTAGFEIFNELGDSFVEYIRLDRIAFAYERLEEYEKAIEYYEKALTVARSRKEPVDVRSELGSVGYVYIKLEKWDKAYEYYKQALDLSREAGLHENTADDLARVGWTLLELGKPQDALKYLNEALSLYQSLGVGAGKAFTPRYSPLLNDLGRAHHALGNRRLAIFYGKLGVNSIQGERQRLRNFDAESQKGFLKRNEKNYRRLADWLIEEGRLLEAEQVLAMLKEEEVFDYLRHDASETDNLQQRAELTSEERDALKRYNEIADKITTIGAEFSTLQQLQNKGTQLTPEQQKLYDQLSTQIQAANQAFQVFLHKLSEEFANRPDTEKDMQENLGLQSDLKEWGEGVVFLYTLVGEDRYRVILITSDTQVDGKTEVKVADLNHKIEDFRTAVMNPKTDPRPLGKELYDTLIKPVEKQLEGAKAKTLLWSLDGSLRLLPLSALWDGKQYFGQKYQNVTVTLASRTRLGDAVSPNWRVLGLGVSEARTVKDPDGTRELAFSPLPAVPAELRSIVRSQRSPRGVLPGQSLLDSEFSENALEAQLLRGYKVVHIASHFSLNPGDSNRSFLLLGDGDVLTVDNMKTNPKLSFSGVELLTLSACKTAVVGKDSSGKEVEGFGYVAQQKGAKAILATLWSVADQSTQLLMSEFYRLRNENPRLTKAAALQMAQREMISGRLTASGLKGRRRDTGEVDSNQSDYSHPYYWSPFILIGNWR